MRKWKLSLLCGALVAGLLVWVVGCPGMEAGAHAATGGPVEHSKVIVAVGSKSMAANVVRVSLADPRVRVQVGLAQDKVGATEELLSIAKRKGAVAAINGTFFNAYDKGPTWDPVGALITSGSMVHKGGTGTVLGVDDCKRVRMEPARFKIVGGVNGSWSWPNNWYAHHMNRRPTGANSVVLYTPEWAGRVGGDGGTSVIVTQGVVTQITGEACDVPGDGFVVYMRGSETSLLSRFKQGGAARWRVIDASGAELDRFWAGVVEGLGAGPLLVTEGRVAYSEEAAVAEGFTDPKILTQSMARSAVGFTQSGDLLFVTVGSARLAELAQIMVALGAQDAMNLDGGASSGLVFNGSYVTKPGRKVSNGLLVVVGG